MDSANPIGICWFTIEISKCYYNSTTLCANTVGLVVELQPPGLKIIMGKDLFWHFGI